MEHRIVNAGWDGLDVAFMGRLPSDALAVLEQAKLDAQASGAPALASIGPGEVAMHVAETGAMGGYRYRCDTGPDGAVWFFKRGTDPQDWNIRVSVKSKACQRLKWHGIKDYLYEQLEAMGASVLGESIGRADFCVDILCPDFMPEPAYMLTPPTATRAEHQEEDEFSFEAIRRGRRVESITIGKMPGRQVTLYDKTAEIRAHWREKDWFWGFWGLDKEDRENRVWRIEVRAGKTVLKDRYDITTWADFERAAGDVFLDTMDAIRYVEPVGNDSNMSRWSNGWIWDAAIMQMEQALGDLRRHTVPGRVIRGERDAIRKTYESQITGLAAGLAVAANLSFWDEDKLPDMIADLVRDYMATQKADFHRKRQRAKERLHFMGEACELATGSIFNVETGECFNDYASTRRYVVQPERNESCFGPQP